VIDSKTNLPVGPPIQVGGSPIGIAITPDGTRAYVVNPGSGGISVIDIQTNKEIGDPIHLAGSPNAIAITPDGSRAYVTKSGSKSESGSNSVLAIDLNTNKPIGLPIPVGDFPTDIAITPDGTKAYVANIKSDNVSVINLQNDEVSTVAVGEEPAAIAITPDGSTAYVVDFESRDVRPIATQSNVVGAPIAVGISPISIAITPDGTKAYVGNSGTISVVNIQANAVAATISAGFNFFNFTAIAITPDGKTAYATAEPNQGVGALVAVDTRTDKFVSSPAPVGLGPEALAIAPANIGPSASLSLPQIARLGAPIAFDASGSHDLDGTIADFNWSFGDGAQARGSAPSIDHAFTRVGTYNAALTVTDDEGCSASRVLVGQVVSCIGSPLATQTKSVQVVNPAVLVKCPASAKPRGCKFTLQGLTKKHKGKTETQVAKAKAKGGKSVLVPLKPKERFIKTLGNSKVVLVKETLQEVGSTHTSFHRVPIRLASTKK
jgi:YVTN family beta-propeller protein